PKVGHEAGADGGRVRISEGAFPSTYFRPESDRHYRQWYNDWISNIVVSNPENVGDRIKAEKPLSQAKVEVRAQGQAGLGRGGGAAAAALPAGAPDHVDAPGGGSAQEGLT